MVASSSAIHRTRPKTPGGVRLELEPEGLVLYVWGDHDMSTAALLDLAFADVSAIGHGDLVIDLQQVSFMDASTLGCLVSARNFLALGEIESGSVMLRNPSDSARLVLELGGLISLVQPVLSASSAGAAALESWISVPATAPDPPLAPSEPAPSVSWTLDAVERSAQ